MKTGGQTKHHGLLDTAQKRQDRNELKLKDAYINSTNPFQCKNQQLTHSLTQRVFPEDVQDFVSNIEEVGQKLEESFMAERANSNKTEFWPPMKKYPTKTCKASAKKVKVVLKDKIVSMKTDISLMSMLLIASRSRDDIDIKFNLSNYEFSPLPKSLFACDGKMHHCSNKSNLAAILESLPSNEEQIYRSSPLSHPTEDSQGSDKIAAIIDGMALLHTYNKPNTAKTCHDLGMHLSEWIGKKFNAYNSVHIVFDTYKDNSCRYKNHTSWSIRITTRIQNNAHLFARYRCSGFSLKAISSNDITIWNFPWPGNEKVC
ncbi:uncharacterized protein LOC134527938 [Bacillus rossius redtenbacheri]|uniref:uncharacterized protein LOC134527938 n=1 Tax=Bacillus rossius redtenbacheri TaxID=93214 RepID=UPI002FDCD5DB